MSANLCDALHAMKPSGDQSRLDVSIAWARTRGRVPEDVPQSVSFPQESFLSIEEAGRQLRLRAFGKLERYKGVPRGTEWVHRAFISELVGRLIFTAEVAGQQARIKLDLAPEDFKRACDALRDGNQVAVTGIIRHEVKAREYELSEPGGFEVIADP